MHTDPTQITATPTDPTPAPTGEWPSQPQPRGQRSDRPLIIALAVTAVILLLVGALVLSGGADDPAELAAGEQPTDDLVVDTAAPDAEAEPETTVPPIPDPDPQPEPEPDPDPDPDPDPEPVGPCDELAAGQTLAVTPGPVELPVGTFAGELTIVNCGDVVTGWSASTLAPSVQLGVDQGLLAPGASVDLQFAVDHTQIVGASMFFTIHVAEPGFESGVMVKVTKAIINPGLQIDPEVVLQP